MSLPIAHAGHWVTAAAYFLPVVLLVTWLAVSHLRSRRD